MRSLPVSLFLYLRFLCLLTILFFFFIVFFYFFFYFFYFFFFFRPLRKFILSILYSLSLFFNTLRLSTLLCLSSFFLYKLWWWFIIYIFIYIHISYIIYIIYIHIYIHTRFIYIYLLSTKYFICCLYIFLSSSW